MSGGWQNQPKTARRMIVVFGLLTLWTLLGPLLVFLSIQLGNDDRWPPESGLEWLGVGLGIGGFIVLMLGTLTSVVLHNKDIGKPVTGKPGSAGEGVPDGGGLN